MWEETGDIWDFDSCDGHSSTSGVYHYHFGSDCLRNVSFLLSFSIQLKYVFWLIHIHWDSMESDTYVEGFPPNWINDKMFTLHTKGTDPWSVHFAEMFTFSIWTCTNCSSMWQEWHDSTWKSPYEMNEHLMWRNWQCARATKISVKWVPPLSLNGYCDYLSTYKSYSI